jgi:hypothetical protein
LLEDKKINKNNYIKSSVFVGIYKLASKHRANLPVFLRHDVIRPAGFTQKPLIAQK